MAELDCPKMTVRTPNPHCPKLQNARQKLSDLIHFFPPLSNGNARKSTSSCARVQSVAKGFEQLGWLEEKSLQG